MTRLRRMSWVLVAVVAWLVAAACSTTQKGAVIGAATGALAGQAIGGNTAGTLVGAAVGGLAGALAGDAYEQAERQRDLERRAARYPPPPYPDPAVHVPPAPVDPTRGEFVNRTPWEVHVFLDASEHEAPFVRLLPNQVHPVYVDIGSHRVVALAHVETRFGRRLVGRYDQTLTISPKSRGWSVRFTEHAFQ